ncbi:MAG: hypothetical protein ABEJ70_02880 [Halobacteriaceae archaeon]
MTAPESATGHRARVVRFLLGTDRSRSARVLGALVLAGVAVWGAFALVRPATGSALVSLFYVEPLQFVSPLLFVVVVTGWVLACAVVAYVTTGYVPTVAVVAVPTFAALAEQFVRTNVCCAGAAAAAAPTNLALAAVAAVAHGLVMGAAGYAVGVGARSVQASSDAR